MSLADIKRVLIGKPFPVSAEAHERLDKVRGLAVFASDPISSNAYATEAIMSVLIILGSQALALTLPVALGIALLVTVVIFSYTQTILHYPKGGGSYFVSKDNLGTFPSLVAAAALLIDYTLTVAVSAAAGVRALTSAFPALHEYRVVLAVAAILLIAWVNLRGVRESGTVFAIPTYAFVFGVMIVILIGLMRYFGVLGAAPLIPHETFIPAGSPLSQAAYIWLLFRAFAAGCTALTGIEAISDGVLAFKAPEARNAALTMIAMGIMAMSLFLGIGYLATHLRIVPALHESVLSQMTAMVVGRSSILYYWVQLFTMLILFLAANTGFQDFPRLSAFLAKDGFLPRWLMQRGDRLVFSSGIILLTVVATFIVILFQADEIAMLPLYAIGVMVSFTLSQAGMVGLMGRVAKVPPGEEVKTTVTTIHYESGWWWKRAVSAVGAVVTLIVLAILVATKFVEGAWMVVVTIPMILLIFLRIKNHYVEVAEHLRTRNLQDGDLQELADVILMPIGDVHRGVLRALRFANQSSSDVRCLCVVSDTETKDRIQMRWDRFPEITENAKLIFIDYEYRDFIDPLIKYIEHVNTVEFPNKLVRIVIPEFVPATTFERLLHNQTADIMRTRLQHHHDIVISHLPHQV